MRRSVLFMLGMLSFIPPLASTAANRFYCSGTEPFWSMVAAQDQFTFQQADKKAMNFEPLKPMEIQYVTKTNLQVYKTKSLDDKKPAMAIFQKMDCSDGMSEHKYDYQVILIYSDTVHRGCCELREVNNNAG